MIAVAAILYLVEFLADKIPLVDSAWDAIHTVIRVPAGAVMAASAFAHFDPAVRAVALLAGGTLALGAHGTKASVRLTANASPEPVSNIFLSVVEDAFTVGLAVLAAFHPVVILVILLLFLLLLVWLTPEGLSGDPSHVGTYRRDNEPRSNPHVMQLCLRPLVGPPYLCTCRVERSTFKTVDAPSQTTPDAAVVTKPPDPPNHVSWGHSSRRVMSRTLNRMVQDQN